MNSTLKSALLGSASFALMLAAAGAANTAKAQPISAVSPFDGFYAGIQGGFHSFSAKSTSDARGGTFTEGFGSAEGSIQSTSKRSLTGATGGIFGGYGMSFGRFYVGGEVEVGFSGASNKQAENFSLVEGSSGGTQAATLTTKIRAKETYGGSLRLGYILLPGALLYSRFGVQRTRFQVRSAMSVSEGSSSNDVQVQIINSSRTFTGFRFGLGTELQLATLFPTVNMGNSFVRIDWSHTWYNTQHFFGRNAGFSQSGSRHLIAEQSLDIKPTENRFMFGIGVRF